VEWDSIYKEQVSQKRWRILIYLMTCGVSSIGNLIGQSPERGDNGSNEYVTGPWYAL